jgi:methionine-rich copper-binding protein CopC
MRPYVFLAGVAMTCSTPAFAHAFLRHADPGAGAILSASPKKITLTFSEKLEPVFSGLAVTDRAGRSVEIGAVVVGGNSMAVGLRLLPPGNYRVAWHAVSVDTHRMEGSYSFVIKP